MKDLVSVIIAAEALVNLRSAHGNNGEKVKSRPKEKKLMEKKAGRGFQRKTYVGQAKYEKSKSDGNATGGLSNTKMTGCFICDGLHRARDCPKCEKLAVVVT